MDNLDSFFCQLFPLDFDLEELDHPEDDSDSGAPEEFTSTETEDFEPIVVPGHRTPLPESTKQHQPVHLTVPTSLEADDDEDYSTSPASSRGGSAEVEGAGSEGSGQRKRKSPSRIAHEQANKRRKNLIEVQARREVKDRGPWFLAMQDYQMRRYSSPEIVTLGLDAEAELKSTKSAYEGRVYRKPAQQETCTLEGCLQAGYRVVVWDGRDQKVFTDVRGRFLVVLGGMPKEEKSWMKTTTAVYQVMAEQQQVMRLLCDACKAKPPENYCKPCRNRRGDFRATSVGLSFGGGQRQPQMLKQHKANLPALTALITNHHVIRIAGIGRAYLATFAPKVYQDFSTKLLPIYRKNSDLQLLFRNSIFPACTFNFGPAAIMAFHYDSKNKANGYIAVTALGDFDHTKGGHLVIKTLKLMIQFPPGSTILFLSAVLEHANTPVQPGESRSSFTQYAAGSLFRWTDAGGQTMKQAQSQSPEIYKEMKRREEGAWGRALESLSTIDSLKQDQKKVQDTLDKLYTSPV